LFAKAEDYASTTHLMIASIASFFKTKKYGNVLYV